MLLNEGSLVFGSIMVLSNVVTEIGCARLGLGWAGAAGLVDWGCGWADAPTPNLEASAPLVHASLQPLPEQKNAPRNAAAQ